jgi:hypothetical protein
LDKEYAGVIYFSEQEKKRKIFIFLIILLFLFYVFVFFFLEIHSYIFHSIYHALLCYFFYLSIYILLSISQFFSHRIHIFSFFPLSTTIQKQLLNMLGKFPTFLSILFPHTLRALPVFVFGFFSIRLHNNHFSFADLTNFHFFFLKPYNFLFYIQGYLYMNFLHNLQ